MLRRAFCVLAAIAAVPAFAGTVARADHAPAFVVPGRADVPVMINGYDASWGVVEGDWGLYRPGAIAPVVIPSPHAAPLLPPARRYFPSLGAAPHSGRYEIEPPANRALPSPAESFHRTWSSASDPTIPVTEYAPSPAVIEAPPQARNDWRWRKRRHQHRHHH